MDKERFVSEIDAHSGMMYRVAWSILRNDDDCKDALQEAALKAWEKRDTLREPSYFRTWITRILINACYETQRKRRRLVSLDSIPDVPVSAPDPAPIEALAALPEKLRLPLVLVFSEGMTYAEAAETLRLPVATVRGRIHRGRERLRKELTAE